MNEATDNLDDDVRQRLVAYLDGELDQETAREVEAQLTGSATVRQELETLKKTWELLDFLPKPQAPENFSQRTMTRLSAVKQNALVRQRRLQWMGRMSWAAGLGLIGVLSAWAAYRMIPASTPAPQELRVLEYRTYWPYFLQVDNVSFLKDLDQPDLFGEDS